MKFKTAYVCEKCSSVYERQWQAELCESMPVPPDIAVVGETVLVQERYGDGPTSVTVIEALGVRPDYVMSIARGETGPERLAAIAEDRRCTWTHERGVKLARELQLGKDFYCDQIWQAEPLRQSKEELATAAWYFG